MNDFKVFLNLEITRIDYCHDCARLNTGQFKTLDQIGVKCLVIIINAPKQKQNANRAKPFYTQSKRWGK